MTTQLWPSNVWAKDLDRVLNVFYPLLSALSDNEMMEISLNVSPKLSDYSTSVSLNEALWKRIKSVYDNKSSLTLTPEQETLLQNTYDSFARNGALLEELTAKSTSNFRRSLAS